MIKEGFVDIDDISILKEAEKYTSNLDECRTKDLMGDAFKDGAEFGYNKANEELEEKIKVKKLEILDLKSQIKKMKCDVIFLIKDRMNDDIDQNIIERLAEKWEIKEND